MCASWARRGRPPIRASTWGCTRCGAFWAAGRRGSEPRRPPRAVDPHSRRTRISRRSRRTRSICHRQPTAAVVAAARAPRAVAAEVRGASTNKEQQQMTGLQTEGERSVRAPVFGYFFLSGGRRRARAAMEPAAHQPRHGCTGGLPRLPPWASPGANPGPGIRPACRLTPVVDRGRGDSGDDGVHQPPPTSIPPEQQAAPPLQEPAAQHLLSLAQCHPAPLVMVQGSAASAPWCAPADSLPDEDAEGGAIPQASTPPVHPGPCTVQNERSM